MNKAPRLAAALLLAAALPAWAQSTPFDMSPESDLRVTPPPASPAPTPSAAPAQPPPPPQVEGFERFLMPAGAIRMDGEEGRAGVVVYLTEAQAASPAKLNLSYLNAVVVAPEISNLDIRVNGTELLKNPIASSTAPSAIAVDVPPGLLHAGANTVEFVVSQRHRTDCSIDSTYELWTEIQSGTALLSFTGPGLSRISQLEDLPAIGVDAQGATTIRVITADLNQPDAVQAGLKLAQNLALALRVANLHLEHATELSPTAAPGVLDVVLGPADLLPAALADVQAQAAARPIAALVPRPSGANTLLVSGPDWSGVGQAVDAVLTANPLSADRPRIDLPNPIPIVEGGKAVSLAELGVPTAEFNGRHLTAQFQFELPFDFYANRYGEAELVLDAAYSADVQPGSEIDIYTNEQIASATPLLRTDGGLLRDTVIRLPMTNLRPGRNEVDVSVNLQAQSDAACSPGWTGQAPVRFVFSSGTQFRLPDYGRAAALPNLQLLTGSGWPYADQPEVPLLLNGGTEATVTAMTLLARLAAGSGKVLPVRLASEAELQPNQDALVILPVSAMSPAVLGRSGLSLGAQEAVSSDDAAALDRFRTTDNGNPAADFFDRALQNVGLTLDDLRVMPQPDAPYTVTAGTTVLAQTLQAEGGTWTVLTAENTATMLDGMHRFAVTEQWRQVGGRVSVIGPSQTDVEVIQPNRQTIVETQAFSPWNIRRVAANWFSGNILAFTAALAAAAVLLMLATSLVLAKVGREE